MIPFILNPATLESFLAKVARSAGPDACWPWLGKLNPDGYGTQYTSPGRLQTAHRVAWQLANGTMPPRQEAHHKCHFKPCCNPAHILSLTKAEHMAIHRLEGFEGFGSFGLFRDACKKGHKYTPENTRQGYRGDRICRICERQRSIDCQARKKLRQSTKQSPPAND